MIKSIPEGYESLADVLTRAYQQATTGKGAERHAGNRPFTEQPMQAISGLLGSADGLLYQAMKKIQESKRLDKDAGIRELLGAINYLGGAVIYLEAQDPPCSVATPSVMSPEEMQSKFFRTDFSSHPDAAVVLRRNAVSAYAAEQARVVDDAMAELIVTSINAIRRELGQIPLDMELSKKYLRRPPIVAASHIRRVTVAQWPDVGMSPSTAATINLQDPTNRSALTDLGSIMAVGCLSDEL